MTTPVFECRSNPANPPAEADEVEGQHRPTRTYLRVNSRDTNNRIAKKHPDGQRRRGLAAGQGAGQHRMACPAPRSAVVPNEPNPAGVRANARPKPRPG